MSKSKNTVNCRFCQTPLKHTFVDLGVSPIANNFISNKEKNKKEIYYPLHVYVCHKCFLVQIPNIIKREEIFNNEYSYFSSYSDSWLQHSKDYVEMITKKLLLNKKSLVVEVASNDGYLLQYFDSKNIPVLGVEPCRNVAAVAKQKGIKTVVKFFGEKTAKAIRKNYKKADLIIGNNVLAHVPDINDFTNGLQKLLSKNGIATLEFPHLLQMIDKNEFDTIYHEHYSYFSLTAANKIFKAHKLEIFDVDEIKTHGGSLRIYAKHLSNKNINISKNVYKLLARESKKGYKDIKMYVKFQIKVTKVKIGLLSFLKRAKKQGKTVVAYGAPAKGNTLLNYCGVNSNSIKYTVDRSPHKQNHVLPGTRIPIYPPSQLTKTKPDYVLILPWNIQKEIVSQMSAIKEWNGSFVVPIPKIKILI